MKVVLEKGRAVKVLKGGGAKDGRSKATTVWVRRFG